MFDDKALQRLLDYSSTNGDVLSLYLNTDLSQQSKDTIKLQAKGLLKEVQATHGDESAAIEAYLNHGHEWNQPGLAVFVGEQGDYFEAYSVGAAFRNRMRLGHKPYVKPLVYLLDNYTHYGVILIDKIGARFFTFHLGELQETEGYMGEEVRSLKSGRGSSAVGMRGGVGGQRRESEVMQRNLREAAAAAQTFFKQQAIRRLFLGGTSETVAQFRDCLSKQLQSCVAGTFAMDMDAGVHMVRDATLHLLSQANLAHEAKVVQLMITTQAKGGNAVVGLDDTLQAVCDKRIQTLVVSDGYRTPGYFNETADFVVANLARSPLTEAELMPVDDVVDTAVTLTLTQGGVVEVVTGNDALEQIGRIGAILRY